MEKPPHQEAVLRALLYQLSPKKGHAVANPRLSFLDGIYMAEPCTYRLAERLFSDNSKMQYRFDYLKKYPIGGELFSHGVIFLLCANNRVLGCCLKGLAFVENTT